MSARDYFGEPPAYESEIIEFLGKPVEVRSVSRGVAEKIAVAAGLPSDEARLIAEFEGIRRSVFIPGSGEPVFGHADLDYWRSLPFRVTMPLTRKMLEMSGLTGGEEGKET